MRELKVTGRTARVTSVAELETLLLPFAGTRVEDYVDNPTYHTREVSKVTLGTPVRAHQGESFESLYINVYTNRPATDSFMPFMFERGRLPKLVEVEGGKTLIQQAEEVCNLLVPTSKAIQGKLAGIPRKRAG